MNKAGLYILLLAVFIMILSLWLFNINPMFILSVLIVEIFISMYFIFFFAYKSLPKDQISIFSILLTVFFGGGLMYTLINVFHFLIFGEDYNHMYLARQILVFENFWVIASYFLPIILFILGYLYDLIFYDAKKASKKLSNMTLTTFSKLVLVSIAIIPLYGMVDYFDSTFFRDFFWGKIAATVFIAIYGGVEFYMRYRYSHIQKRIQSELENES